MVERAQTPPASGHSQLPCLPCQKLALAEAVANAEYDWSKATDCRVLMKRHRESGECVAGQSV
ncbi:hypothetical protein [Streptomyces albidoflavus]|uniref:hypothetical protein n=1 Tax=Streptomyces albidoflavus TaxID=1886 RepID=UPI0033CA701E